MPHNRSKGVNKAKLFFNILLVSILLTTQVTVVSASASLDDAAPISGTVQAITLETDPNTGVTTVLVAVLDEEGASQSSRISQETAVELGLVTLDEDGNPVINEDALGLDIEIDPSDVIPGVDEIQHPVGSALATFFSNIPGLDYDTIMNVHEAGNGFGVIAQALWLTLKLEGDSGDFITIIEAKKSGDFSDFILEDGTSPMNWGQFKKTVLDGDKKNNPSVGISNKDKNKDNGNAANNGNTNNNGNENNNGNGNNKDKDKDKKNNGNGNPNKP
jgi:hypothetical protein